MVGRWFNGFDVEGGGHGLSATEQGKGLPAKAGSLTIPRSTDIAVGKASH